MQGPPRRLAAGAELYAICGTINTDKLVPSERPAIRPGDLAPATAVLGTAVTSAPAVAGAYVGESSRVGRAEVSYRAWVEQAGVINATAVVLIHRRTGRTPMSQPRRRASESSLIRHLGELVFLTNVRSRTSAVTQLSRDEVRRTEELATAISTTIFRRVFDGRLGPLGGTQRTRLIRLVREHGRTQGLDARQIVQLAHGAGLRLAGPAPTQTCRRDLQDRARADRVQPPVYVTWHDGKTRVFFHPQLGKREALRTYRRSQEDCA